MSTTKGIVGVLIALLGMSAFNSRALANGGYAADGGIILADSASDRARQEAQRREEQRREDERRRREEEQHRQEEQRQRAEERRREDAAAEQKRKDEAAEQKRKEEQVAEQHRRETENRVADQRRKEEQAAEQRRREVEQRTAEQKRAATLQQNGAIADRNKQRLTPQGGLPAPHSASPPTTANSANAPAEQKKSPSPPYNGTIADRNKQGLTPQGSLPAPQSSAPTANTDSKGGYGDRRYAGPNGQVPTVRASANPVSGGMPGAGTVGDASATGKAGTSPNWGPATGGPTPLTTNRGSTTTNTGAAMAAGAAAGTAAGSTTPKTREEKLAADKAVKDAEKAQQQQAEQEYLKKVAAGVKLVAVTCLGGEGKYYATGSMPKIRPEVVSCIDVHFQAICPGSNVVIDGVADNFIGMGGCFGDTYTISPKPACNVKDVKIRVVDAQPGCGTKK